MYTTNFYLLIPSALYDCSLLAGSMSGFLTCAIVRFTKAFYTVHISLPLGTGYRQSYKSGVGTGRFARLRLLRHDVGAWGPRYFIDTTCPRRPRPQVFQH
jgi:hypothetical protein